LGCNGTVFEQNEGRNTPNIELGRNALVLVDIHLGNLDTVAILDGTGLSAFRTSCSKDASLTCLTPALMNIPYQWDDLAQLSSESAPSPYIINKL